MTHYNTTDEQGQLLMEFQRKAAKQDDAVRRSLHNVAIKTDEKVMGCMAGLSIGTGSNAPTTNLTKRLTLPLKALQLAGLFFAFSSLPYAAVPCHSSAAPAFLLRYPAT